MNFLYVDQATRELRLAMTSMVRSQHERCEYRVIDDDGAPVKARPGREAEVTHLAGRAAHHSPGDKCPWYVVLDDPDRPKAWFRTEDMPAQITTDRCPRGGDWLSRKMCALCSGGGWPGPEVDVKLTAAQQAAWAALHNPERRLEGWLFCGNGVALPTAQALERLGLAEFADWSTHREWAIRAAGRHEPHTRPETSSRSGPGRPGTETGWPGELPDATPGQPYRQGRAGRAAKLPAIRPNPNSSARPRPNLSRTDCLTKARSSRNYS